VRSTFWKAREEGDEATRGFAEDLFRVATAREAEIDALLDQHSKNWRSSACPPSIATSCAWRSPSCWASPHPRPHRHRRGAGDRPPLLGAESIDFLNGVLDAIAKSRQ